MADLRTIDDPGFLAKLQEWQTAQTQAARWKLTEMQLRQELFGFAFLSPVEGTNKVSLPHGWTFSAKHKINRTIDQAALPAAQEQLRVMNVNADELVKYKPDLVVSKYKLLSEAARLIFDQALTIKPGSPEIELVPPKEKKE